MAQAKQYRYIYQGEALRYYRQTTIYHAVDALDPDGYIATADIGDSIVDAIDWGDSYLLDAWQDCGPGRQRRLLWETEAEASNDHEATGMIVREEVES